MLTSKQRSYLNSLAVQIPDIIFVGKDGINDEVVIQTQNALKARELIKGKVQQNAPVNSQEAADELAKKAKCEIVRVIGSKFILYKKNPQKKENIIPTKNAQSAKK
ncbi:MAG: YhbY family RNA-binding protein [Eubacteriaceae bacterium]|jgi:RNA-binding protein